MRCLLVGGTWSWRPTYDDWYGPGSAFAGMLMVGGLRPLFDASGPKVEPFIWSSGLAGLPLLQGHAEWQAGGVAAGEFVKLTLPVGESLSICASSHALQLVLYGLAEKRLPYCDYLVSVGSPIRGDMKKITAIARPRIGHWLHICSDWSDRMQVLGELFDRHVGIMRRSPDADANDELPGIGHTEVLRDPALFHYWRERNWLRWLGAAW